MVGQGSRDSARKRMERQGIVWPVGRKNMDGLGLLGVFESSPLFHAADRIARDMAVSLLLMDWVFGDHYFLPHFV